VSEWRRSTWGEEVSLEYGKALRGYVDRAGGVRVFGANGPIGWTDRPLADGPGVILGRKGAYRGVHYSRGPFFVIDTAYYVVPRTPMDMRWLYYAVIHYGLGLIDDGSPIPSTTRAAVYLREIHVPPIDQQESIARVLASLDDKIDHNDRLAQLLADICWALFRSWFVSFDPVHARRAGHRSFPSMDQGLFDSLPRDFVDSPLGPIPKGWRVEPISELVGVRGGGTPSTKNSTFWDGGTRCWATPRDLSRLSHPILLDTERHITQAGVDRISSGLLPPGTVLMSSRAPVGYLALAGVPTAVNQGFIAMECDRELPGIFILHWARSAMDEIRARASGTTFPEISKKNFGPILVAVPPNELVEHFSSVANAHFDLIRACLLENARLSELRTYLLPRLMSGKVRVGANG
jgi:type I restriction enzyme S subunit